MISSEDDLVDEQATVHAKGMISSKICLSHLKKPIFEHKKKSDIIDESWPSE